MNISICNKLKLSFLFVFFSQWAFINFIVAQTEFHPTGRLVDAGGHKLHINVMGEGEPTVIFENGSGDFSFIWSLVQPEVAKITRTLSYDRAGYAWSEPGPTPRTARQISTELHTALFNAGLNPPYILVGQSFGGFLVRDFARYYPNEVVGMVLVEALNENSRILIGGKPTRIREFASGRIAPDPQLNFRNNSTPGNGIVQPDTTVEFPLTNLPDSIKKLQVWAQSQPVYRAASDSEMSWSPEDVENLYENRGKAGYTLGNIPLIVLTRGSGGFEGRQDSAELENERLSMQKELAGLSSNSKHIVDKNSGHNIHLEDPKVVINAIEEVIQAVRTKRPLKK